MFLLHNVPQAVVFSLRSGSEPSVTLNHMLGRRVRLSRRHEHG
jgi:hypothetical protein